MTSRISLLLGASALTLSACASTPPYEGPPLATPGDRHRINVQQTGERIELPVSAGDVALSPLARGALLDFASSYLRWGHGALILSTPANTNNSDAAALVAHETRLALVESGVPYAAIAGSSYEASGRNDAPLLLSFTRYEAQAPDCRPLWEQDLAHQSNNQPWESFGCSLSANLAAMIEDPHDLIAPRGEEPRDSGRRGTVMNAYRQGQQTHAERSNDERVQISDAVE